MVAGFIPGKIIMKTKEYSAPECLIWAVQVNDVLCTSMSATVEDMTEEDVEWIRGN